MSGVTVTLLTALSLASQEPDAGPIDALAAPVRLDLDEVDSRIALEQVAKAAGVDLHFPEPMPEKFLTLRLEKPTFWEAFDELCRRHGKINHALQPFYRKQIEIEARPWKEVPAWYRGPFRLSVFDTARIREFRYPERQDRTEVILTLQWTANFMPILTEEHLPGTLRVTAAKDDAGRSLLPLIERVRGPKVSAAIGRGPAQAWVYRLQPAAKEAKTISRIDGEWSGALMRDIKEIVFKNPAGDPGQVRHVGPMAVRLTRFTRDVARRRHEFTITLSVDPIEAGKEWKASLEHVSLGNRILRRIKLDDPAGYVSMSKYRDDRASAEWRGTIFSDVAPKALRIGVVSGLTKASVPFTLTNIPLPEVP